MSLDKNISSVLKSVSKPGRYTGGEYNAIIKNPENVKCRFAFCFPDTYEIGMSNLGVRILYDALNRHESIWCERVYAPWVDMKEKMEECEIPLFAHESHDPVSKFDMIGFSLQYEMSYTTTLAMLKLANLPIYANDRDESAPIIIGGGPCAVNPEPVADFFDLFNVGEGEEMLPEICELYIKMKTDGSYTKEAFLREVSHIEGVYVPSLYEVSYNSDGTVKEYKPKYDDVPKRVKSALLRTSTKPLIPKNW